LIDDRDKRSKDSAGSPDLPLRWTSIESWFPLLTSELGTLLEPGAVKRLQRVKSSGLYDDDPEWLDLVVAEFVGEEQELVELLADRLQWRKVRVFHGTRVADAGTFTRDGIRLHDRRHLEKVVRDLVAGREELGYLAGRLDERFAKSAHLVDEGRCFVVVDERVLVEECGHYLLGGSEFVQGIIGPSQAQAALSECAPTVVEVDLPLSRVEPGFLTELTRTLAGEWAKILRRKRAEARRLDFTFTLRAPVPPEWIVGHYHPAIVCDPHSRRTAVDVKQLHCAACAADRPA
jgi:hypothetical protein